MRYRSFGQSETVPNAVFFLQAAVRTHGTRRKQADGRRRKKQDGERSQKYFSYGFTHLILLILIIP